MIRGKDFYFLLILQMLIEAVCDLKTFFVVMLTIEYNLTKDRFILENIKRFRY